MLQVALTPHEVDSPYTVMPDRALRHRADPGWPQAFALCSGYIKGILQGAERFG